MLIDWVHMLNSFLEQPESCKSSTRGIDSPPIISINQVTDKRRLRLWRRNLLWATSPIENHFFFFFTDSILFFKLELKIQLSGSSELTALID